MKKPWYKTVNLKIPHLVEVIGVLNPIGWDKNGNVKKYSIYTQNEEDIIIEYIDNPELLQHFINNYVLAKGSVRIDLDGEKYIRIKHLKALAGGGPSTISRYASQNRSLLFDEFAVSA